MVQQGFSGREGRGDDRRVAEVRRTDLSAGATRDEPALGELRAPEAEATVAGRLLSLIRSSSAFNPKAEGYAELNPPLELGPLTLIRAHANEQLLVVRDPAMDPALSAFLDRHGAAAQKLVGDSARAEYLLKAVGELFAPTWSLLPHPVRQYRFRQMTVPEDETPRLLGEFISNRIGVCRHVAPLLQLAFQEAGISSVIMHGTLRREYPDHPDEKPERSLHVWNVIVTDGRIRAVDPVNKLDCPLGTSPHSHPSAEDLMRRTDRTSGVHVEIGTWWRATERSVLKPQATALWGSSDISERMLDRFVAAVERAGSGS